MLCILCAFGLSYAVDETSDARLLASKTIMNQLMVATKDITIQYNIYNIGGRYVYYIYISMVMNQNRLYPL